MKKKTNDIHMMMMIQFKTRSSHNGNLDEKIE